MRQEGRETDNPVKILRRISPSVVVLVVLIILTALWLGLNDNGLLSLYREKQERDLYLERIEALRAENEELLSEVERLRGDMNYLESVARRELKMIKENEVIFRVARKNLDADGEKAANTPSQK